MIIIGLCGQSGAGKTTALDVFSSLGTAVVDCDAIARLVTQKGNECLDELSGYFGKEILDSDGNLIRQKLADIAFSEERYLEKLNEITHRHILREVFALVDKCRSQGLWATVIDAPVLFESGLDKDCDTTLAICAEREKRIERIILRDGISRERAEARIARQLSEKELEELCDFVIYNNGSEAELVSKITDYVKEIKNRE